MSTQGTPKFRGCPFGSKTLKSKMHIFIYAGERDSKDTISGIMTFVAKYLRCDHCRSHALEQYGALASKCQERCGA